MGPRSFINRPLHLLARICPGSRTLRPFLHRLRGVKIQKDVFIGDDVYIENEFPDRVEIQEGAQIGLRSLIVAHLRGPGRVIIERQAFIGANVVIAAPAGTTLRIGEGSVVAASSVITSNVAPYTLVSPEKPRVVAKVGLPLAVATSYLDFLKALEPVESPSE